MEIRDYNLGSYIVPEETEGGVCLEIGANVGSFTEKYQNHFKKIHYYEPITRCFNLINDKLKSNHISGFNMAGYSTTGEELKLLIHHNNDSGSTGLESDTLNSEWTDEVIQSTTTISLEDMIKNLDTSFIDYCKSDCETGEYYIFMDNDISQIKYLAMEMHHQMGPDKWERLLNHILKTHNLISAFDYENPCDSTHAPGRNKDLLFKLIKKQNG